MNKKILFVIDMQNDFIDGSLGSTDAKRIVPNVVKLIQNWNKDQQIWYTQDTHYENFESFPNYLETLEGKMLPIKHCIYNTPGWQINEYVQDALTSHGYLTHKFIKETFGSLLMANEATMWLSNNINSNDEIFICGLCSDICVLSNTLLLRAQFPNLKITCYEDCCAGTSIEAHTATMLVMKSNQITIDKVNK